MVVKIPLSKVLLLTYDELGTSGSIFKIFGPMQSNPVDLVKSRLFKKFHTNELLMYY